MCFHDFWAAPGQIWGESDIAVEDGHSRKRNKRIEKTYGKTWRDEKGVGAIQTRPGVSSFGTARAFVRSSKEKRLKNKQQKKRTPTVRHKRWCPFPKAIKKKRQKKVENR